MTRHKLLEDVQAMLTGSLLAAMGIVLFKAGGLLAGGTVGLALLASYGMGLDMGAALVVANAPFYVLACFSMGREFTLKTLVCVALTALFVHLLPKGLSFAHVSPVAAAVMGGLLMGIGLLVLFRHAASLGGLNVLVLWMQRRFGWSPGLTQLAIDAVILVGGSAALGDFSRLAHSIAAVAVLNMVLAINHRPGRYRPAHG